MYAIRSYYDMRITQYPDGVYCTGSLATYLQGGNVLPLTRRTVEDALGKLETETGWDLKKAELVITSYSIHYTKLYEYTSYSLRTPRSTR